MIDSTVTVALAALVTIACTGAGNQVLWRLGFKFAHASEALAFSAGAGFALLIGAMTLLGFIGGFYSVVAWVLLLSLLALGVPTLRRIQWNALRSLLQSFAELPWPIKLLSLFIPAYASGYLLSGLFPPLDGDSLYGYLVLPREYARQHAIVVVDYAYGYYYPQNGQLLGTLGFLLQGEALASILVSVVMGLLTSFTAYAIGRAYFGKAAGVVAAVAFYSMFAVGFISGSAKVDLAWAFFDLLGIFAFSRWYFGTEAKARWLILAGAFVGIGLATKYSSFYTIAALGLALIVTSVIRRRKGFKGFVLDSLAFGLPIMLSALWLVRTYLLTGNPVYPMFNRWILGYAAGEIGLNQYDNILLFPRILWDMSMGWIAGGMGKPVGPVLLAAIPLLLLFRKLDPKVKPILLFCAITGVIWYFGIQRPRHIFPTLALLSVVAGYTTVLLLHHARPLGIALVLLTTAAFSVNLVMWARSSLPMPDAVTYALGLQSRDQFLKARVGQYFSHPDYDVLQYINGQLPSDARLVGNPWSGAAYYIERPIYPRSLYTSVSSQETLCDLKEQRISHVWVNFDTISYLNSKNPGTPQPVYWPEDPQFSSQYLSKLYSNTSQGVYEVRYPPALDCSGFQLRPWYS